MASKVVEASPSKWQTACFGGKILWLGALGAGKKGPMWEFLFENI